MTTATQDKSFLDHIIKSNILEDAVDWIGINLSPEDVFSDKDLEDWALDNGFIKE
ncbi:hypothetical protein ACFLXA_02820 [Chloroflexota bacterium]